MKNRKILFLLVFVILLLGLSSCAPIGYTVKEFGFFGGTIHGLTLPLALLSKLFGGHFDIYASNNTGFSYWLGFIFGPFILIGAVQLFFMLIGLIINAFDSN